MPNLILLLLCLLIGILLQNVSTFPKNAHLVLNSFIIYVCLPALTLVHTTQIRFQSSQILPVLVPYLLYVGSALFFGILSPKLGFDRGTTGALTITAGISSVSFVGFPIFEMLYGHAGLQLGILMSQAGSFVVCGTLGIVTASYYSSSEPSLSKMIKGIFSFPPFIAFCLALIINVLGYPLPKPMMQLLEKIGSPFSIIALVSVGLQISFKWKALPLKPLLWGLGYKLVLAPIFIYVLYVLILGQHNQLGQLCVLAAGIGSMNTATIIAINHNLNPKLASLMVGIGIPLSLGTLIIIYFLIH